MPYHRYVPGKQDRQNAIVPDTTSNQLGVLTAVVEDEDRGVAGEYVRAGSHFEFVPALGRRADGRAGRLSGDSFYVRSPRDRQQKREED